MKVINCDQCKGFGVLPGKICDRCHSAGIAFVNDKQVLVFARRIDRVNLFIVQLYKTLRSLVAGLVIIFGIIGLASLAWEAWPNWERIFTFLFWQSEGRGKLIFSISLFADLYLVVRWIRYGSDRIKVFSEPVDLLRRIPEEWPDLKKVPPKKYIDVSLSLSKDLDKRIGTAYKLSVKMRQNAVGLVQLFVALLDSNVISNILSRLEVDQKELRQRVVNLLANESEAKINPEIGNSIKEVFVKAYLDAQKLNHEYIEAYNVLFHTISSDGNLKEIFFDLGVDENKLKNAVRWFEINYELARRWRSFKGAASRRPKGAMNRSMTALQTKFLDRFSDDLTMLAGQGYLELVINREKEFEEIFRILQGEKKSVLLIGPHGVGKQSVIDGIAEKMVEEKVPKVLSDRRLVSLSLPKIIAGAHASEAQERLLNCFNDLARAGNVVLAIPNIHESIGESESGINLGEVIATELNKEYFLSIATTTPEEYRERIEGKSLDNAFVSIKIGEPDLNAIIHILESKVGVIEFRSKTYFSYSALEKAAVLSDLYLKERFNPEKSIDVIKEAAQQVANKRGSRSMVRGEDVAEIISVKSKIPVAAVTAAEADKLVNLEKIMHQRIIGQDEAVKAVATALRRSRAGLREGKRPIANFLFLGSTGVGKTETAKTVAEAYFGNEKNMIRVDMSEFQNKESLERLIGAAGEKGGLLTEAVRKNPFSIVLLDEIEKAHPDILNLFLQVMDDGRLTDSVGRVIDFTNAIVIMTSNAGTPYIQSAIAENKTMESIKKSLIENELKQYFKPEFLNRFDGVVLYKPLEESEILQIAKLILAKVSQQVESKGIVFKATDEAIAELAHAGFDPQFGARPLRRVIQERVNDSLANLLLENKLNRRDAVILEKGGGLRIEKARKL